MAMAMANQDQDQNQNIRVVIMYQGSNYQLQNIDESMTCRDLKSYFCEREGINSNNIRLIFLGRTLIGRTTLREAGIRNGSIIHTSVVVQGGGGDDEKKEGGDERRAFINESRQKKQYYNQFTSLSSYANSNVNINNVNNSILVNDPHFVLTLNDLGDFGVNSNDNNSEINKLKELKNCIKNKLDNPIINNMRRKLGTVYQVDPARVVITDIYYGTTNVGYVIIDYEAAGVVTLIKNAKEFESKFKKEFKSFKEMIITPVPESVDGSYALVKSFHVSCASGKACGKWNCPEPGCRIAGVVLYMKNGQKKWKCNGRSCRMGYIIVKQSNKIQNLSSKFGSIHGKVYKSVFNEEADGIVGSGFSRSGGVWKWGSGSFNGGVTESGTKQYHDSVYTMSELESKWIEKAIRNWWNTGNQNTKVDESLVIFKN